MNASKPIRDALAIIEAEAARQNKIETLCGHIVATLVVNRDRGAFGKMDHHETWLDFIRQWDRELHELREGATT